VIAVRPGVATKKPCTPLTRTVSVLPPTVACTVRTVAEEDGLAAGGRLACGLVAAAAVIPTPIAAAAARLMLAMMILGCRTVKLLVVLTVR
jgi:hypothetical protein